MYNQIVLHKNLKDGKALRILCLIKINVVLPDNTNSKNAAINLSIHISELFYLKVDCRGKSPMHIIVYLIMQCTKHHF